MFGKNYPSQTMDDAVDYTNNVKVVKSKVQEIANSVIDYDIRMHRLWNQLKN